MKNRSLFLCVLLPLLLLAAADADEAKAPAKKAASRYTTRQNHDPDGIGKFYMGREIAHVMGYGPGGAGADWLERPEREKEEASTKMIEELKLEPGQVVADIGAGTGRLSLMMAEKVGNEGKVLAVDVQQEMLDIISVKLKQRGIKNVELVKGTQKSPKLEKDSVDLALFVDVYHEFAFPYEMMLEISKAVKVGGRVAFVEFRKEDVNVPIKLVHKMTEVQVKKEIGLPEFHFKWKETIGTLPWQHVIIFEKEPEDADAGADAGKTPFPEIYNSEPAKDRLAAPAEALAKIKVPDGFQVTLFAAEPDVQQPIAITTDERGRLWVAENYTYSESKVNFNDSLRDRIVILEDTDGDGRFDERTVFWDGAKKLTSVEVGFGGVWARCAPELRFIPDGNRDDVPDGKPVVILDGWDASAPFGTTSSTGSSGAPTAGSTAGMELWQPRSWAGPARRHRSARRSIAPSGAITRREKFSKSSLRGPRMPGAPITTNTVRCFSSTRSSATCGTSCRGRTTGGCTGLTSIPICTSSSNRRPTIFTGISAKSGTTFAMESVRRPTRPAAGTRTRAS